MSRRLPDFFLIGAPKAGTSALHAALALSPVAHGRIEAIDVDAVRRLPGVVDVVVAADIPGTNDCGPVVHDDPILADGEVHYLGQPVLAVIATSRLAARRAARDAARALRVAPLPALLTPREAHAAQAYVLAVEEMMGARVSAIGVGPDRTHTVVRHDLLD